MDSTQLVDNLIEAVLAQPSAHDNFTQADAEKSSADLEAARAAVLEEFERLRAQAEIAQKADGLSLEQMDMRAIFLMVSYNYDPKQLALVVAGQEGEIDRLRGENVRLQNEIDGLKVSYGILYNELAVTKKFYEETLTAFATLRAAIEHAREALEYDTALVDVNWYEKSELAYHILTDAMGLGKRP